MGRNRQLPLVRVFADNGRWWLLNLGEEPVREVTVTIRVDDDQVIVDGLTTPLLAVGEQRCVAPDPWSSDAMIRVDVSWQHTAGRIDHYSVDLPANGLRAESAVSP